MVFKESDEMAQLKQQQVETEFELFRKFAKIVDPKGNWDNITVGGVMNFMGRGRRNRRVCNSKCVNSRKLVTL
ncbi:unnamed protein product [Prunus armeniaca]